MYVERRGCVWENWVVKRDWDVIREVLLEVEALDEHKRNKLVYRTKGADSAPTARAWREHALMLRDGGFLEAVDAGHLGGRQLLKQKLTWKGHELLATMRSKELWLRIKKLAADKGLELTFDSVKALAAAVLTAMLDGGNSVTDKPGSSGSVTCGLFLTSLGRISQPGPQTIPGQRRAQVPPAKIALTK